MWAQRSFAWRCMCARPPAVFEGTMDSIDQGVNGLKMSNVTHDDEKVRFEVNPPGGVFEA